MCRFLLITSKKAIQPKELLNEFAMMCKKSSEWQGDGWGMVWKVEDRGWKVEKSLKPIWEDKNRFDKIPKSKMFAFHARGASFPKHKDNLAYNQPFVQDDLCFVFNGELYGVSLQAPGEIGSQKIFRLLERGVKMHTPDEALEILQMRLLHNAKSILGCNIAFFYGDKLYASCQYGKEEKKDYYTLRYFQDDNMRIICSEKIGKYRWRSMQKGDIIAL